MLKLEFPPEKKWFKNQKIVVDLGYQGIKKDYESQKITIPHKKPRSSKKNPAPQLTPEQKEYNQLVGKQRICVENALSGVKRFQSLCVKYRGKTVEKLDDSLEICAGLWNYKLKLKSASFG